MKALLTLDRPDCLISLAPSVLSFLTSHSILGGGCLGARCPLAAPSTPPLALNWDGRAHSPVPVPSDARLHASPPGSSLIFRFHYLLIPEEGADALQEGV